MQVLLKISLMHSQNNRTIYIYEAPLAFLVEKVGTLLDLEIVTLFKVHYNSIKQGTHSKTSIQTIHHIK